MQSDVFLCTLIAYDFQRVFTLLLQQEKENKMNIVNTRTIIIIKNRSSCKAKVHMPNVLKDVHAWLHEDMQQVQLGGMLGLRNVVFSSTFPFTIPYISSSH